MRKERGSALIVAVLVMVILTLLGISFLLLAETENRIAENERRAAQALYFAESGARSVVQWFQRPGDPGNLVTPPAAALDRTLRKVDDDGDPATPPHDQDGSTWPRYKQGIDANGDGFDDFFDRPYRFDLRNTFLGTEDGPDVRIDAAAGGAGRLFLDAFSDVLLGGFPDAGAGVRARILRIDVYAPPYLNIGGAWTRYGVATVKVIGRIVRTVSGTDEVLAERMVKVVLGEIPYATPFGPLHSCRELAFQGPLTVAWGAVTAVDEVRLDPDHTRIPASFPREIPAGTRVDLLWGYDSGNFAAYRDAIAAGGRVLEDPWLRVLAGGAIVGAPAGLTQPYPFAWTPGNPLLSGQFPAHEPGLDGTHSNLFQGMELVGCPELDYELWKSIATSGQEGVEYYAWDAGAGGFRRDGVGAPQSFRVLTDLDPSDPSRRPAVRFFDTADGLPPHDDDADGSFDNLTPAIAIDGGTWSSQGVIVVNARTVRMSAVIGRPAPMRFPGEPFQDSNQNGRWDAGEGWVNLRYPAAVGGSFRADAADGLQDDGTTAAPVRNARGPLATENVAMNGILFTSGLFEVTGGGGTVHYGSVIARGGIVQPNPLSPSARIYWAEGIRTGDWPPADWGLPRVTATRWETDL